LQNYENTRYLTNFDSYFSLFAGINEKMLIFACVLYNYLNVMNSQRCQEILQEHQVKPTANRIVLFKALASAERPLSLAELEQRVITIDKSGIFRALTLFREHGLVHVIDDASGARYEVCHSHDHSVDDDMHVHFYCERCHTTFCLENIPLPGVDLPDGYTMQTANYIIKGICPACHHMEQIHSMRKIIT
jgi:Fur family ferric uptake transcriptional regulator